MVCPFQTPHREGNSITKPPPKKKELRLVPGDELRLRNTPDNNHPAWNSVGHVIKIASNYFFSSFFAKKRESNELIDINKKR